LRETLAWTVEYDPRVEKDLKAIDRAMQREILGYMDIRIATDEDPRRFGKPLRHELRGLLRNRVRDFRIICDIREQTRVVFVRPPATVPLLTIKRSPCCKYGSPRLLGLTNVPESAQQFRT
jgi:mRNA interferase RelE/StbE